MAFFFYNCVSGFLRSWQLTTDDDLEKFNYARSIKYRELCTSVYHNLRTSIYLYELIMVDRMINLAFHFF